MLNMLKIHICESALPLEFRAETLRDEPGADKVAAAINAANTGKAEIIMHKANL